MKIVYSYYVLDIIHIGHINHMRNSKSLAGKDGISIVGILTNEAVMEKKPTPILSFEERMNIARAIKYNDIVIPQDTYSPLKNIKGIKPDIMMESSSHNPDELKEILEFMESIHGKVIINPYYPYQSSSDIKNKIREGKD